jgi:hypothetical protein
MNLIGGKLEAQINKSKEYPNYHYYIPSGSLSKTMGFIELQMGGGIRAYNR